MKQSPELQAAQQRMQPGVLTRDGMLGRDRRALAEILEDDENAVRRLGLSHQRIAERMAHLTDAGRPGLGTSVEVDEDYEVRVEEWRGGIPCPWGHAGMFRKSVTHARSLRSGEELEWTDLAIHMIRVHGFYGGRGAQYRVPPADAARVLGLQV